jgi:hypothetical protein
MIRALTNSMIHYKFKVKEVKDKDISWMNREEALIKSMVTPKLKLVLKIISIRFH